MELDYAFKPVLSIIIQIYIYKQISIYKSKLSQTPLQLKTTSGTLYAAFPGDTLTRT